MTPPVIPWRSDIESPLHPREGESVWIHMAGLALSVVAKDAEALHRLLVAFEDAGVGVTYGKNELLEKGAELELIRRYLRAWGRN